MKRKTKPRVTQLDRIELRLRKINLAFDGVEHYIELRQHCAVLASHNRRLLEENDTLRRWLSREREKKAAPQTCKHEWTRDFSIVGARTTGTFAWICDRCGARKTTFTGTT